MVGALVVDAMPLRLLQLFMGLPWISTYTAAQTAAQRASRVPSRSNRAPLISTTSTRPAIATTDPRMTALDGARRVRTQTAITSSTGAMYWISRATATGMRCIAAK